jgi:hypothetical protein
MATRTQSIVANVKISYPHMSPDIADHVQVSRCSDDLPLLLMLTEYDRLK